MEDLVFRPAVAEDAAAVTEVVSALESSLYGGSAVSQADLEADWATLDLGGQARVIVDGGRVAGYGAVRQHGGTARAEGCVHPAAQGRGIGNAIATVLEEIAARDGAHVIHNSVLEADSAGRALLESLGYVAVRVFREMRIELEAPPAAPDWPEGVHVVPFDPERDARAFHAANQEAFAEHWGHTERDFETWSKSFLESDRFDPTLWCVVRAGHEIAGGTSCTADTFGGGFVQSLFTCRPWRKQGLGAALLADAFGRFWDRGERSVGLAVDAENTTGAFRLYERAGMAPRQGGVVYEKRLGGAASG